MKSRMSLVLFILFIAFIVIVQLGCQTDGTIDDATDTENGVTDLEVVTLSAGTIFPIDDPHSLAVIKFGELLNEKTGGTINIELFPAGQTGGAVAQLEMLSEGTQDIFFEGAGWVGSYVPNIIEDSLFFALSDRDEQYKYLESDFCKDAHGEFSKEWNIRILANNFLRAPRAIVSKTPISSLEDIKGKKWRLPAAAGWPESAVALGASPVQVPWGEVYLALQQGVVDMACSMEESIYTMKFHEVAPYITLSGHILQNCQLYINEDVFQSLSPEQQDAMIEAAYEAGDYYSALTTEAAEINLKLCEEEGATIIYLDDEEKERWKKAVYEGAVKQLEDDGKWDVGRFTEIRAFLDQK